MSYGTYCGKCGEYTANYTTGHDAEGTPMIVCVEYPKERLNRIYRENNILQVQMDTLLNALEWYADETNLLTSWEAHSCGHVTLAVTPAVGRDAGDRAREAISKLSKK